MALLLPMSLLTCLHAGPAPKISSPSLVFTALPRPDTNVLRANLGAFEWAGAWTLESRDQFFGGVSAMLSDRRGGLIAYTDNGFAMRFRPSDGAGTIPASFAPILPGRLDQRTQYDAESASADPGSGDIWIGWEGTNAISRQAPSGRILGIVRPREMQDWGGNQGPEAMVRLANGRFLVLREGFEAPVGNAAEHRAVRFDGDPTRGAPGVPFRFAGPTGFKPTDMAQWPDGRVLILMRKVVWPMPPRFAGRLVLADPADIQEGKLWTGQVVANLGSILPGDNFEAMAIVPRTDGRLDVWVASDNNRMATLKTVLWRLVVDPRKLAPERKKARGPAARPFTTDR